MRRALLLPFALGCAGAASMAPLGLVPLLFVALSGLYLCLAEAGGLRRALVYGYAFGLGYFLPGLYWVGNALLVPGNAYWWAWPLAALGLPALMAVFPALATALAHGPGLRRPAGFAAFIGAQVLIEWVRGHIATGLPWNLYGYALAEVLPLAQVAALWDVYLLTLLAVFWAALPGYVLLAWPGRAALALAALGVASLAGAWAWGAHRLATHPTEYDTSVRIRVVQPTTDQAEKWAPGAGPVPRPLQRLLLLSYPGQEQSEWGQAYVVWPETALARFHLNKTQVRRAIGAMLEAQGAPRAFLLTGFLEEESTEDGTRYHNSLALLDHEAHVLRRYDKAHLVPFGEYIPFADYVPLEPVSAFAAFTPGPGPGVLSAGEGMASFAAQVCYESIFPGSAVPTVLEDSKRPVAIVNATNDAWYGASPGPYQHFAQARLRAVEEGLPLIRAASSGVSGVVDPVGRVLAVAPLFLQTALETALPRPVPRLVDRLPGPLHTPQGRNYLFLVVLVILMAPHAIGGLATMRRGTGTYP
ncbi:MAG TPA: apolipoprotein N-acyltransferase [Rhodospirillaceae bacterium]|nr:apolipoprotein N-acyltransferase [Alphaproteobacteria bacterium]HBH25938.1 apolipoprotein N-acyltransferase [Rhodospirillaceae bacterium]